MCLHLPPAGTWNSCIFLHMRTRRDSSSRFIIDTDDSDDCCLQTGSCMFLGNCVNAHGEKELGTKRLEIGAFLEAFLSC